MRLSIVVILAVLSAGLAAWWLRAPVESGDVGGAAPAVGVGKPAAFHLDLDPAAKVRVAQRNFGKIASDEAVRLGEWKDDIALLCDDPNVVAWIAAEWHVRKEGADRVTLSAFADIFERVKHPEFLEATKELFRIDDAFVAGKAVQAAITQADPSLLDEIRHAYDVAKTTAGPETTPFRVQCILAARACGGPGLSAFLGDVLTENNLVLRIEALQVARDIPTVGIESVLRSLTGELNPRVRLLAAWALAKAGSTTAVRDLAALVDPNDPGTALEAASAIGILRLEAATPALVAALDRTAGETHRAVEIALARLDHGPTLQRLRARIVDPDGTKIEDALTALTSAGIVADIPLLSEQAASGLNLRQRALCAGIAIAASPTMAPVMIPMLGASPTYTPEMHDAMKVVGEAVVPNLSERLAKAKSEDEAFATVAWLGSNATPAARAALLRGRNGPARRLCEEQLRLLDLAARRAGR